MTLDTEFEMLIISRLYVRRATLLDLYPTNVSLRKNL